MNEKMEIDKIRNSLDKYHNLKRAIGTIDDVKTLYNFPYPQDKNIYEWNLFGILNSEDFSDELIEETKNKIKTVDRINIELISWISYLNFISFKRRILTRLDFLVDKLGNIYSHEQLKAGLTNNPFSFLSELEFANFCLESNYKILEIEPILNSGKKLDIKIEMDGKPTVIEVITPRLKLSMQQKQVGFFPISAEIENNIKAEFEHHEIEINDIKENFILVIDGDYAGIDMINIQSAIEKFYKNQKMSNKYLSGIFLKKGDKFNFINS